MTEKEIFGLILNRNHFMDITDFDYSNVDRSKVNVKSIPKTLKYQDKVNQLLPLINNQRIFDFVRHFSSYHNRLYASVTGRESQRWLLGQVQASVLNYAGAATVHEVDHGYLQRSIVARLQGANPALESEVVILGAHLDSINRFGASLNAPGADDNGSGSVVLLETLRNIIASNLTLQRTVEFQWYAAEEIGLRGSQAIAQEYRENGVNVVGMLNFDVVSYYTEGVDDIGVFTDNGHEDLMVFLRLLTDEYLDYGWQDRTCGYGCSDHASWTNNAFPAVMASEYTPHPDMHTVYDNIQNMHFTQLNEFIKLAKGFAVEMAAPI